MCLLRRQWFSWFFHLTHQREYFIRGFWVDRGDPEDDRGGKKIDKESIPFGFQTVYQSGVKRIIPGERYGLEVNPVGEIVT